MFHKNFNSVRVPGLVVGTAMLNALGMTAWSGEPQATHHGIFGGDLSAARQCGGAYMEEMLFRLSMLWTDW